MLTLTDFDIGIAFVNLSSITLRIGTWVLPAICHMCSHCEADVALSGEPDDHCIHISKYASRILQLKSTYLSDFIKCINCRCFPWRENVTVLQNVFIKAGCIPPCLWNLHGSLQACVRKIHENKQSHFNLSRLLSSYVHAVRLWMRCCTCNCKMVWNLFGAILLWVLPHRLMQSITYVKW